MWLPEQPSHDMTVREAHAELPSGCARACGDATFSVLQHNANREVPRSKNLSWRLVRSLLHEPVWFAGILAITVGFLLQAAAPWATGSWLRSNQSWREPLVRGCRSKTPAAAGHAG